MTSFIGGKCIFTFIVTTKLFELTSLLIKMHITLLMLIMCLSNRFVLKHTLSNQQNKVSDVLEVLYLLMSVCFSHLNSNYCI